MSESREFGDFRRLSDLTDGQGRPSVVEIYREGGSIFVPAGDLATLLGSYGLDDIRIGSNGRPEGFYPDSIYEMRRSETPVGRALYPEENNETNISYARLILFRYLRQELSASLYTDKKAVETVREFMKDRQAVVLMLEEEGITTLGQMINMIYPLELQESEGQSSTF